MANKDVNIIIIVIIVRLTSRESNAASGFCRSTASLSACDEVPAAVAAAATERLEDGAVLP